MSVITHISEGKGITGPGTGVRLDGLLDALGLPRLLPDIPEEQLLSAMGMDKKNLGRTLRVIVLDRIGVCHVENTTADFFRGMCSL